VDVPAGHVSVLVDSLDLPAGVYSVLGMSVIENHETTENTASCTVGTGPNSGYSTIVTLGANTQAGVYTNAVIQGVFTLDEPGIVSMTCLGDYRAYADYTRLVAVKVGTLHDQTPPGT
jgi:hypothetical protein